LKALDSQPALNNCNYWLRNSEERITMLDFNLYYAQATAESRRRTRALDARSQHSAKRVFQLPSRRDVREGSAR
jgi:hypothetical protein